MDNPEKSLTPAEAVHEDRLHELRAEMTQTRTALTDKLRTLEERMTHTVDAAQNAVEHTVATVQEGVDSVVGLFNVRKHTEEQPWLMLGAAFATGAAVAYMTTPPRRQPTRPIVGEDVTPPAEALEPAPPPRVVAPTPRISEPPRRGLFADEWNKMKGLAVGVGMALVRDWIKEAAPGVADKIDDIFSSATRKLGGEPVEGPIFEEEPVAHGSRRRF